MVPFTNDNYHYLMEKMVMITTMNLHHDVSSTSMFDFAKTSSLWELNIVTVSLRSLHAYPSLYIPFQFYECIVTNKKKRNPANVQEIKKLCESLDYWYATSECKRNEC